MTSNVSTAALVNGQVSVGEKLLSLSLIHTQTNTHKHTHLILNWCYGVCLSPVDTLRDRVSQTRSVLGKTLSLSPRWSLVGQILLSKLLISLQ